MRQDIQDLIDIADEALKANDLTNIVQIANDLNNVKQNIKKETEAELYALMQKKWDEVKVLRVANKAEIDKMRLEAIKRKEQEEQNAIIAKEEKKALAKQRKEQREKKKRDELQDKLQKSVALDGHTYTHKEMLQEKYGAIYKDGKWYVVREKAKEAQKEIRLLNQAIDRERYKGDREKKEQDKIEKKAKEAEENEIKELLSSSTEEASFSFVQYIDEAVPFSVTAKSEKRTIKITHLARQEVANSTRRKETIKLTFPYSSQLEIVVEWYWYGFKQKIIKKEDIVNG